MADGLINKFYVERLTPSSSGTNHTKCRYFVIDLDHDPFAQEAMRAYIEEADYGGEKALASDLRALMEEVSNGTD